MANARHLPAGRSQAGDRHLNFHDYRDNLLTQGVNYLSDLAHEGQPVDLVWALDTDVFILRPDTLTAAAAALAEHDAVFAGERDDYTAGAPVVTESGLAMCSVLFDPAVVWHPEHRPFLEDGEPSRHMQGDLLAAQKKLLAFPFCTAGYILHLGRGTLATVIDRADETNQYHAWAEDHSEPHYGLAADGPQLAAAFESAHRVAAGGETTDELVALFAS